MNDEPFTPDPSSEWEDPAYPIAKDVSPGGSTLCPRCYSRGDIVRNHRHLADNMTCIFERAVCHHDGEPLRWETCRTHGWSGMPETIAECSSYNEHHREQPDDARVAERLRDITAAQAEGRLRPPRSAGGPV